MLNRREMLQSSIGSALAIMSYSASEVPTGEGKVRKSYVETVNFKPPSPFPNGIKVVTQEGMAVGFPGNPTHVLPSQFCCYPESFVEHSTNAHGDPVIKWLFRFELPPSYDLTGARPKTDVEFASSSSATRERNSNA